MFASSRLLTALLAVCLSSCASYLERDDQATDIDGQPGKPKLTYVGAVGGKGALIKERHHPSGVVDRTIFTWDNEDSFRRAASLPVYQAGWNGVSSLGSAATKALKNQ